MRRALRVLVTVLGFLLAWGIGAAAVGPELLPSPLRVAARLAEVAAGSGPRDRGALYHLGRSLLRVAVVSTLGLALSTALGLAMGLDDRA
jgi:ABC-type nitrate/sulfonate/bicarbonate transport system permease component